MNILFICTANRDRSRTAEHIFQDLYPKFNFKSAGIDEYLCNRSNGSFVDVKSCDWANRIICMEEHHAQYLVVKFGESVLSKIEILGIEDTELYMSKTLIKMLKGAFKTK